MGLYDELGGDERRSALELSGGQQQRLCIARALAVEPSVLLLDEPCSALDIASTSAVEDVLRSVAKTCAIVIVTHNLAQARRLADDVVCMSGGEVAWEGASTSCSSASTTPCCVRCTDPTCYKSMRSHR